MASGRPKWTWRNVLITLCVLIPTIILAELLEYTTGLAGSFWWFYGIALILSLTVVHKLPWST